VAEEEDMINTIESIVENVTCDICGSDISFNKQATVEAYKKTSDPKMDDILGSIDDILERYLVYSCNMCGAHYRYTYKELEKVMRRKVLERVLLVHAREYFEVSPIQLEKYLVYCGKCPGYDGSGRCPKTVFHKCKIKEFPVNEI
jgi:DNA-directed RNA polymerase subunit M/transcription elongation factor TFIIS